MQRVSKRRLEAVDRVKSRVEDALVGVPTSRLLVAMSGGADSTCLAHVLVTRRPALEIAVCHVDHGLRSESVDDAGAVNRLCTEWETPCAVRAVDTRSYMRSRGVSVELAARTLRYEALRSVARELGAGVVTLGHTFDDQVETVLMHVFRGAGLEGVAGMRTLREDLFRPLLWISHWETIQYCRLLNLPFLNDPSNDDPTPTRNRVRHDLLPAIERVFPGARDAVARLARSAQRDADYLEQLAQEAIAVCAPEGQVIPELWMALPESLRFRVLRRVSGVEAQEISFAALQRRASVLEVAARERAVPPAGMPPVLLADRLLEPIRLRVPGKTYAEGLGISAVLVPFASLDAQRVALASRWQAYLDADTAGQDLILRSWRPGDRMLPLGAPGVRKLQDVFVDRRIPRDVRERIPLIAGPAGIVWIPGVTVADAFRVRQTTSRVVFLSIESFEVRAEERLGSNGARHNESSR